MMERLEGYLDKKRLALNTKAAKVIRFRKEEERIKKAEWRWKDVRIDEVRKFEYLRYTLQRDE